MLERSYYRAIWFKIEAQAAVNSIRLLVGLLLIGLMSIYCIFGKEAQPSMSHRQ
jgi:hypothetical protein